MARQTVYRKAALDKLSSPEELDRLMRITSPASWLVLAAFGAVLLMVLLWGVFGQITTTLEESGILTLSNPLAFINAPEAGQVVEIIAKPGDVVETGEIVAYIATQNDVLAVTATTNGRIVSTRTSTGDPVDAGMPLLSVESYDRTEQPQEVVLYVPLEDRHLIRTGMNAQVLPSTVEREEYGYLEGRVFSVSEWAATREEMLTVLGDESFVDTLMNAGFMFEIRIMLRTNQNNEWVWSASNGPDIQLLSGTPCSVRINVNSERPINQVFTLG
jgi:hypothetical protein